MAATFESTARREARAKKKKKSVQKEIKNGWKQNGIFLIAQSNPRRHETPRTAKLCRQLREVFIQARHERERWRLSILLKLRTFPREKSRKVGRPERLFAKLT